ncbi:MAG: DUF2147 domain-containing protein [Gammaproteobacteria bacterium]
MIAQSARTGVATALLCGSMLAFGAFAADTSASDASASSQTAAAVAGNWLTEPRDGIIQLSVSADGSLEGRIVGGNAPQRTDEKNPDPALRSKLLRGQVIVHDMKYDGDSSWSGGTIYDPDSGRTYRCNMTLIGNDQLKVRGYIGFSLLGRTQLWTRYTGESLDLPPATDK